MYLHGSASKIKMPSFFLFFRFRFSQKVRMKKEYKLAACKIEKMYVILYIHSKVKLLITSKIITTIAQ